MELKEAVKRAKSYREVCDILGVNRVGGAYRKIRNQIIDQGLDISHFKPFTRTGRRKRMPLSVVMVVGSSYPTAHLRKRLVAEGVMANRCAECGCGDRWNGRPITLHLDHINGVSNDHRLENLRILCPNCHSQTDTYCGRNVGHMEA